jgi:prepilin-type N-terminal cleavage/methylation domain-containing protein
VQQRRQTENDQDAGFTLIELLVVMIIIGILAAIAIPTFLHQRQNAIATSQVSDLRSVAEEIEGFYVNQEQYPSNFSQAGGTVTITTASGTGTQRVTVGNSVTYSLDATGTAFCLLAANSRAAQNRVWISDGGGIQPLSTTTCPY